jgi:hypothetical protein
MNFFTLSSRAIVAIAQQNPSTWFKLCEIAPFVTEDVEWWHKDTLKSAYTQVTKDHDKNIFRHLNTSLHRDGGLPAIEYAIGNKSWWILGKLHRDNDLPAIEWTSGTKVWYILGKCHRDNDLPAVEWATGGRSWYKNGQMYWPKLYPTTAQTREPVN